MLRKRNGLDQERSFIDLRAAHGRGAVGRHGQAAVRVMFVGHFAAIAIHGLAVGSSRVSVALTLPVAVGK
jgi:hypothetical protein